MYQVMSRKYPNLMIYKSKSLSLESFYERINLYNKKLQEEYGIPYFPAPNYNPIIFYENIRKGAIQKHEIWRYCLRYAIEACSYELIDFCISKGAQINMGLLWAVQKNISESVDYLLLHYNFAMNDINLCLNHSDERDTLSLILYKLQNL